MGKKYEEVGRGSYRVYREKKPDNDWIGTVIGLIFIVGFLWFLASGG